MATALHLGRFLDRLTGAFMGGDYEAAARLMLNAPEKFLAKFESSVLKTVQEGAEIGYIFTASTLRQAITPKTRTRAEINALSKKYLAFLLERGRDVLGQEGITQDALYAWVKAAGNSAAWHGVDMGSEKAARAGGAEYKTWVRAWARKEARAHSSLEGTTIPIDEMFVLPSGKLAWSPRDWEAVPDPKEWVYCGHGLIYSYVPDGAELDRAVLLARQGNFNRRATRAA